MESPCRLKITVDTIKGILLIVAKVNAVAFNEESNVAFSASMDCTIQAFDARSRSEKPVQVRRGKRD